MLQPFKWSTDMAYMIPSSVDQNSGLSYGEAILFELFKALPSQYYVFHSLRWNEVRPGSRMRVLSGETDFLFYSPERGIICIEVKDGGIKHSRERGWIQINRGTLEEKPIDPFAQADRGKYYFLDILRRAFGGPVPFMVCSAVWFSSVARSTLQGSFPLECSEDTVLFAEDMSNPSSVEMALHRVFAYFGANKQDSSQAVIDKVLNTLSPEFSVFASPKTIQAFSERIFHRMTREQGALLDYLDEQTDAAIKGIAGTGKTILAVEKAKRLAAEGPVLFLCFNSFLRDYLAKAYAQPNIAFNNLDTLMVQVAGNPLPLGTENAVLKEERILEFLMDWDIYGLPYQHFIIDEGQDFNSDHLQAIHEIADKKQGCFYVFYDSYQFVQGKEYPEWLDKTECRLVLSKNCRNTHEIAITSSRPIRIDEAKIKMLQDIQFIHGAMKPSFYSLCEKNEMLFVLTKLIDKYLSMGISTDSIVVLSLASSDSSLIRDIDMRLSPRIYLSKEMSTGKIWFTTVRKFKGLEAEVVIVVDVDGDALSTEQKRSAFYVGASRAKIHLDILACFRDQSDISKFVIDLTGQEQKPGPRALAAIANTLKVVMNSKYDLDA